VGCSRALLSSLCVKRCRAIIPCFFPRSVSSLLSSYLISSSPVLASGLCFSLSLGRPALPSHRAPFPVYSHKYTLSAAARILLAAIDIHILLGASVGPVAASGCVACHLLVVASDLADDIVESVVDVDARLRRGLDELAAE
jgi:hypothetical protein